MPIYLSTPTVSNAVDRLAESSASSKVADFLIFKRALVIARLEAVANDEPEPTSIVTGLRSKAFVQAINEFTSCYQTNDRNSDNPYYVPFGSRRDKTLGYRTIKFPSNGSSDTVNRWQGEASKPLEYVVGTSPKEYRLVNKSQAELEEFFLIKGAQKHFSGKKPLLVDAAIWWFRFSDLEERFREEPTEEQLATGFIEDVGLTETELSAFFLPINTAETETQPDLEVNTTENQEGA